METNRLGFSIVNMDPSADPAQDFYRFAAGGWLDRATIPSTEAFDDPEVTQLTMYKLGDGGAMSGPLVADRRTETSEATFLVLLVD